MAVLVKGLTYRAARRGLIGGSRPWLVILVVLVGGRVLRWIGSWARPASRLSERLEVGDRLEIAAIPTQKATE